jgi:flagellin
MTVEESACVKIQAGSELSDQVNEFIAAAGLAGQTIQYSLAEASGQDDVAKGKFSINSGTGEILASLDFERPTGGAGDNSNTYTFDVQVLNTTTNQTMTETITLNVTDFDNANRTNVDEAVWDASSAHVANGTTPDVAYASGATEAVTSETNTLAITADSTADTVGTARTDISTGLAAFAALHTDADTNGFQVISIDGTDVTHTTGAHTISTGVTLNIDGTISVASNASATTIEDVHIRYTADNGRVFDVFTDITASVGNQAGVSIVETNAVAAGNDSTIGVKAGGEAATLDLKAGGTAGDNVFDGISNFYALNPCGIFTVENAQFNGAASTDISVDNSGVLTLAAGAAAGTYTADVYYEDNEGDSYVQRVNLVVTEVGIRGENGNGAAADKTAVATAHDTEAPSSYESTQVRGVSTINIAEARQGTIKSVGSGAVLSSAMNTFVNTDYPGGSFALSGTDASLFTVDASTGDISTIGLVDYESKTSYDFSVTYTNGSNSYTEEITLRVGDDNVDNTTHIIDVNLGTQAGSASAVTILDNAINQISSSQAKLGAIQNRLQYNIDNLSKATMLTQTAKGRIVDADFAAETSELSKQQILSQAATSMLAQANQSKQSVLALLQ